MTWQLRLMKTSKVMREEEERLRCPTGQERTGKNKVKYLKVALSYLHRKILTTTSPHLTLGLHLSGSGISSNIRTAIHSSGMCFYLSPASYWIDAKRSLSLLSWIDTVFGEELACSYRLWRQVSELPPEPSSSSSL